jgi:TolA-binding protein
LIDDFKDHPLADKAKSGRANARLQAKDHAGAAADATAYLSADSGATEAERADALFILGLAQVGDKKQDAAVKTFESILKDHPQYAGGDKVLSELAWAHKSSGDDARAVDYFTRLAERHPDSSLAAESNYHVGEHLYHQKKDYAAAARAYQQALSKTGKSELGEKAQHKLAWAHYQQDDFAAAEKAFAQQLAEYAQGELAADAAFMNAEALFKQNKYDAAHAAFARALATKPSSEDFLTLGLLHAGQAAAQLKKWDESLRYLQDLSNKYPESAHVAEALFEQGEAKRNQRKFDDAIKLYESAAEKAPVREVGARARFMVGEVLFEQGNHKDAVRSFFLVAYGFSETGAPESIRTWQAYALYESGRCFEVLATRADAKSEAFRKYLEQAEKLYAELLEKYPKSDKANLAKQRLTELRK